MKQAYWNLDLIRLSAEDTAVHLNREFILIDNFNEIPEQSNSEMEFVNHPVKLSFTVAIFCLKGRMQFQSNLQEFELRANDVLILQKGAIGEYEGMDEGTQVRLADFFAHFSPMKNRNLHGQHGQPYAVAEILRKGHHRPANFRLAVG